MTPFSLSVRSGRRGLFVAFAVITLSGVALADSFRGPFLIEGATIHGDQLVFGCGGDLWSVAASGGQAQSLLASEPHDSFPCLAPDGKQLAFLRRSERVADVYLLDVESRETRRLTYHPAVDLAVGWTSDSKRVLIQSNREADTRLFTMATTDHLPTAIEAPHAYTGALSRDGARLAYLPRSYPYHFSEFRFYRGGTCSPLWILTQATGAVDKVTDNSCNVRDPMWIGDDVWFLWDRRGQFELYVLQEHLGDTQALSTASAAQGAEVGTLLNSGAGANPRTSTPRRVPLKIKARLRTAATDGRRIVLVTDYGLLLFDPVSKSAQAVPIEMQLGAAALQPRIANASSLVESCSLSADARQVIMSARGDVLLLDVETSRTSNLTRSPGVAEREARLSADGKRCAYFSDASGEYALHVREVNRPDQTVIPIEDQPTYYRELSWCPSGKWIAFSDKRHQVWVADLEHRRVAVVDRSQSSSQRTFGLTWSSHGRYLAYARYGEDRLPRIHVYDAETATTRPVSPPGCFADSPTFDRSGRYLYFLSSPNAAAADFGWGVLGGHLWQPHIVRHLQAVSLQATTPPPVIGGFANPAVDWQVNTTPAIDFDEIETRIVPTDVAPYRLSRVAAGSSGVLYLRANDDAAQSLFRLDLRQPSEVTRVIPLVDAFTTSGDGRSILCGVSSNRRLVTFRGKTAEVRPLPSTALAVPVDPMLEWTQILREAWRIMRDSFYDPSFHGLDWNAMEGQYRRYLPGIRSRQQMNVLLRRLMGELSVSHLGVEGGDIRPGLNEDERIGLLGADIEVSAGLYRFRKVLRSCHFDSADHALRAPLDQPGQKVEEGEFLLAIDDTPIDATQSLYAALRGLAMKPVRLQVGPNSDRTQTRTVFVVPLANEEPLRRANVAEHNRLRVRELSEGKLAYFHVPSYGATGLYTFLRGYFASRSLPGCIIDQRHNGGGITSDTFIEMLARRPWYYYHFREGDDLAVPVNGRQANATVLMVDEQNGSAAETFAMMFRLRQLGPIVGFRTGGGGIGPYADCSLPMLIDGGELRVPARAAYNPSGTWDIENAGIAPDIEVEILPEDWRAGRDLQLEAAVSAGLKAIQEMDVPQPRLPAFPVHPQHSYFVPGQ